MSLALAAAVLLPGMPGAVKAVAIELDGEPELGPARVHSPAADQAVGARQRQAGFVERHQESPLERAERDAGLAVEDGSQPGDALVGRAAGEDVLDLARRRLMAHPGLVAGTCQPLDRDRRRKIHQRARHGRDRDSEANRGVATLQPP
jgi:hypothetical protein